MITSRSGDKHRKRALELGVKRYLGKPYQEAELLELQARETRVLCGPHRSLHDRVSERLFGFDHSHAGSQPARFTGFPASMIERHEGTGECSLDIGLVSLGPEAMQAGIPMPW